MNPLAYSALAVLAVTLTTTSASACDAGPDFCTDDPRIPALLDQKKAELAKEYPAEFVALLDIGQQCVARIRTSPDGFSLMEVGNDDSIRITTWDSGNQAAANAQIADGRLREYWIIHTRHAFSCAGEPAFQDRPDYDSTLDLNTSFALRCDTPDRCLTQ